MYVRLWSVVTVGMLGVLQAQTLDLKGRVMANGAPVAGATVSLKTKKDSVKTGADGTFTFTGSTSLARGAGRGFAYRLDAGFLAIEVEAPEAVRAEVVDGAGHVQGSFSRRLDEGSHRIALSEAMPAPGANAGVYFLRLSLGGETFTHPFFHSGKGATGEVFGSARMAAAKRAAGVDSLLVRMAGFQDYGKEIASYTAGNLGDLTLTPTAAPEGWVNLFNGKDLTGWIPLIHKGGGAGINKDSTFRPDLENNGIRVSYDKYTGGFGGGDCKCGNLFYNKLLTNYRVRITYRFFDPQISDPPSWGKNNSGLMIFGIDPTKVTGDPVFPPIIEIQLLGTPSGGGTTNGNYCDMGSFVNPTVIATHTGSCGNNKDAKASGSGKTANAASVWTTLEADVHPAGETKVYQLPDTTNPVLVLSKPTYGGKAVTNGYLAIQSESQPIVFKDILLKELPQ